MLSLRVSKPKLRIPCFFVSLKKQQKKKTYIPTIDLWDSCQSTALPLKPKASTDHERQWWNFVLMGHCVLLFFFFLQDTERWLRSTEEAKCRLNVEYKHCKLLFHCWGHQWNVPTGRAQWGATQRQEDSIIHRFWDFLCDCLSLKELFLFWTE